MKKIGIVLLNLVLLLSPMYVSAEEEGNNTEPTPTPTATPTPTPTPSATPTPSPEPTSSPKPTSSPEPTPTPTATPEEEKPIENTLKSIEVKGGTISPSFKSTVYEYTIKVTDDKDFKITYETTDDRTLAASPELSSKDQLNAIVKNGNKTTIKVTYTDSKDKQHTNTYNIKLDYVAPEKSAKLSKLKVDGYDLDKTFVNTEPKYSIEIPNIVDTITITAEAEDSAAKITYNGKESNVIKNLVVGDNNIKITITNDSQTYTYYLSVKRKDEEIETSVKDEAESLIKDTEEALKTLGDNVTTEIKEEIEKLIKDLKEAIDKENEDDIKTAKEKLEEKAKDIIKDAKGFKKAEQDDANAELDIKTPDANPIINRIIVSLATLVGLALGGFGIYFFIKTSPKRMKKELLKEKNKKEDSPIVEVKPKAETVEALEETKEFKLEDTNKDA